MGVENVSPACDRGQEHNPSILSVPVTNYPWIRCYFTHAHSQQCCRVFARNVQHTDAELAELFCQFLYTICGYFVINVYSH